MRAFGITPFVLRLCRVAAFVIASMLVVAAPALGVTLAWDPVANATGYRVHYGSVAGDYPSKVDVGNVTTYALAGLQEGATYHFVVTAYNAAPEESDFSEAASASVPYSVPVAQFGASATSGVAPVALNFVDGSTGVITTYSWTFGDGATSNAANPSHVYSTPGVYTVGLTVTGPGGSDSSIHSNYITVTAASTAPPVSRFTANVTSGPSPLTVDFTSTSTGSISSYAWKFGDGATGTGPSPEHTYSTPGKYTVTLTVTGPAGTHTLTRTNYIQVKRGRQPSATTGDTQVHFAPLPASTTLTVRNRSTRS